MTSLSKMDTIFDFSHFSSSPLYFFILSVIPWAARSVKRERKIAPGCVFRDEVLALVPWHVRTAIWTWSRHGLPWCRGHGRCLLFPGLSVHLSAHTSVLVSWALPAAQGEENPATDHLCVLHHSVPQECSWSNGVLSRVNVQIQGKYLNDRKIKFRNVESLISASVA